ncbi:MAG: ornithine cyclodeaminase [Maritimibacter sp.]
MSIEIIPAEAESLLDWRELTDALLAGHRMPRAELGDTFLYREPDTLWSRSAWIDGMGMAVKTATVFPDNRADNLPMVNGAVNHYSDDHGVFEAIVDFHLVTKWKTAADSLLAARLLAPEKADCILIIGAGEVAKSLREAYGALFPKARFMVWNRSSAGAEAMAANYPNTVVATDLESGVMASDIVTSATMARAPLIMGEWLQPGQHIDLIGAYRPDMREADDVALTRARVFVDSRETVLNHIGELKIPLEAGVISRDHVAGDFYDIESGAFTREAEDITLFKNGGGAHLDLITSRYILDKWRNR